jgi:hypothetical protein
MKRHIGKIKNTDQRCVVVFMQIPGKEDHALVVSTDNLPPRFEQALMDIVESTEGQADAVLANVLSRRLLGDTGQPVLQALHESGFLRTVHIDQVVMLPLPNMPFPLRQIIIDMGGTAPVSMEPQAVAEKFNPHTTNADAADAQTKLGLARGLLIEAEMLEGDARRKREQAYRYAPELKSDQAKAKVEMMQGKRELVEVETVVTKEATAKRTRKAPAKAKQASGESGI